MGVRKEVCIFDVTMYYMTDKQLICSQSELRY